MFAAFVAAIAWQAAARADDVLDRGVRFHIPASPLTSALIEFSTQSGVQVAAADADVAHLNSNGVSGTLPIRTALGMLLQGTGLEYSSVGAQTVAIRVASAAGPAVGALASAGGAAQPDPNANASAPPLAPDVTVTTPPPPSDQELAGDSLYHFVVHHATVHYVNTGVRGNLAHWRGGLQSICPLTGGLDPGYNAFVTARLRALAAYVGAPVQSDARCKGNVRILFTTDPQKAMQDVAKWAPGFFGIRYPQMLRLVQYRGDHAIQGWYLTTSGGARALNTEVGSLKLNLLPIWPQVTPKSTTDYDDTSGIGVVMLIVDTSKVAGYAIGTIADYLGMLALSVVQSPDYCDPLPSILDLMSSNCGAREAPAAMTAGDLAFLRGLYYLNTGLGSSPSRDDIRNNMLKQFKGP